MHIQQIYNLNNFCRIVFWLFKVFSFYKTPTNPRYIFVWLLFFRNATAKELVKAHDFVVENSSVTFFDRTQPYRPILDGVEFTDPPLKYFQSAKFGSDLKIIIGTTSDEAASIKVDFENETMKKDKFIVS